MEENTLNVDNQINNQQNKIEPKIVNLCEDMNYHEHDEKSYKKMTLLIPESESEIEK